ncbi:MAG: SDR family NAD(P)-dependent oxidoreductase [Spirochaetes bacterium]|nr:SDR family NAD(P)-dependent oxidoreductase [Spirochaetota bacterium]
MDHGALANKYGPWAIITGGASGIGAEFGRQLAAMGLNLVIVDVQAAMMKEHAGKLMNQYGTVVRCVSADLSKTDFMKKVRPVIRDISIGLLVNNAAWGSAGEFMKTDMKDLVLAVEVNCRASMILTREVGPAMVERGRGGIIFLSSSSAMQGTPIVANYAATKAFNLILAEALWDELRGYGIDVLALCPGATNTPAFAKSGANIDNVPGMPFMEPAQVVAEALEALGKRPSVIAGTVNRVAAFVFARLLSRRRAVTLTGRNTRLLYPDR